ncbi:hypothetical protein V8E36_004924 [Tilletia maclaganii]
MMVFPPHSSTPRWVPTASSSNTDSGVNSAKAMASMKRKREDDAEDQEAVDAFSTARRMRMNEHARPSICPLQSPFSFQSGAHSSSSSASSSLLPTPSSELAPQPLPLPEDLDMMQADADNFSPAGVAWLGHPLPASSFATPSFGSAMPTPPLTPSSSMLLDGGFGHAALPQGTTELGAGAEMQIDASGHGWNGVDFPASMFSLQLNNASMGHVNPYGSIY